MATLMILRHAPPMTGGKLAGRSDVDADCSDTAAFAWMRARLGTPAAVLSRDRKSVV